MADAMNQDWHTQAFRSRLVAQIEESMRVAGTSMGRSAVEMENHVYQKAQTRDEYMALVARLILHVKEYNKNRPQQGMGGGVNMGPHGHMNAGAPPGMGDNQGGIQDPMNALQNLARQGGQQGQPPGPPQQGMMGPQHGMHAAAQHRQQLAQQHAALIHRGQLQQRPTLQRQDAFIVTSPQNVQPMPGQVMASSANMPFHQATSAINTMTSMGRPGMMAGQGMPQPFLPPGSQQAAMSMGSDMSPMPQSSPAPGLPSPSPQPNITPSPANRGMVGAPSPSTYLNTPGNPPGSVPSPGNAQHTSTEEQMYLEKLYMLSKYIEPLRRSVNNLEKHKDEDSKKNYTKMKNLLDILTDANKRVSMQTLLRCELALKNWSKNVENASGAAASRESGSGMLGQPLYDAIAAHISSPTLNHTLHRTFGSAMAAFLGEGIRCPSPPKKRQKVERKEEVEEEKEREGGQGLPLVLQREIANLGNRFHVSLDPLHHPSNTTIHLVCTLDDLNLPSVPPVLVTIPPRYPKNSPVCEPHTCPGYDASNFFKTVSSIMAEMMRRMSDYSLTALLNAWEMSVRKACLPSMTTDAGMLNML
ncbi:uncharacterized protein LOC143288402 isoform X2 [Babylonia areolata]|uniref:uncharacterized protein LOC143288402 isoform X2 n=1 Tax=Babylonia areolata TaxID=304850 RepID=UPI003FCF4885